MNWKRIWTGSVFAAAAILPIEWWVNRYLLVFDTTRYQRMALASWNVSIWLGHVINSFIAGFFLIWLYVAARSRLGPGPKTAIAMGTMAWLLFGLATSISLSMATNMTPMSLALLCVFRLLECWLGAYLAGWQYIEMAP